MDCNISDVITKLFSLANDPTIAVITLENVVMLFEIHEEVFTEPLTILTTLKFSDALHDPRSSETISRLACSFAKTP